MDTDKFIPQVSLVTDENLFSLWELIFLQPTYLMIAILASLILIAVTITKSIRSFIYYIQQKKALELFEEKFWSGISLNQFAKEIGDKKKYIKQKSIIEDIFIAGMSEIQRFKNFDDENKNLMPKVSQMKLALGVARQQALWRMIELNKWFYNFYITFLVLYILAVWNFIIELQNIFKTNPEENIYILFPIIFVTLLYLFYTSLFFVCRRFYSLLQYKLMSFCDDFLLIIERNSKSTSEDD